MNAHSAINIRFLRSRKKNSFSMINEKIESFFIESYRGFILEGLKRGYTTKDLEGMRKSRDFFRFPFYANSQLLVQKMKLRITSVFFLIFLPKKSFYYKAKEVLNFYINACPRLWSPSFIEMSSEVSDDDHLELEFHIIPSPYGFNWDAPRKFFVSLRNYFSFKWGHKIGHAFVVLKINGRPVVATGMTGETNYQVISQLLFMKGGFEFLFKSFRGRLESSVFVLKDIERHKIKNKIETLSYNLSKEQFGECLTHLKDWTSDGTYRNYGLPYCLGKSNGGSCTSFAVNFLHLIGEVDQEKLKHWKRTVKIPHTLIKSGENSVGFIKLFSTIIRKKDWAVGEEHSLLSFWDPDKIYYWIKENKYGN